MRLAPMRNSQMLEVQLEHLHHVTMATYGARL